MPRQPHEVRIGGKAYRLVTSAEPDALDRLAKLVDEKLKAIDSRHPDAILLAALALANDVEALSSQKRALSSKSRAMLESLLARVDGALDHIDEDGNALPSVPRRR
jgi:cell division protein ZapA